MMLTNKRSFVGWLVLLICLPYLISLFSLAVEIASNCDTESVDCLLHKRIFPFAVSYFALGFVTVWITFSKSAYWRVMVWVFLVISIAMVIYDFHRSPGLSFWETIQIKTYALRVMFDKGDAMTFVFLFGKDFLNSFLLFLACAIMLLTRHEPPYTKQV